MPDLYDTAARFRADLLRREAAAMARLLDAYADVDQSAAVRLRQLLADLKAARAGGRAVPVSWLYQRDRLARLRQQVRVEVERFGHAAEPLVLAEKRAAAAIAGGEALELVHAAAPAGFPLQLNPLRPDVVEQAVAFLAPGSALRDLLAELGPDAEERIARALVTGVALGHNPQVIAREVSRALDGNRARALTIARTETLRSYREATRLAYQANAAVLRGWVWFSTLDRRTCAVCIAMTGTEHSLEERLDGHPNCRCSMVPVLRQAIGRRQSVQPGPERFAEWDEERQLEVLGPSKLAAFRRGDIALEDLVRRGESPRWGTTRTEASLAEARDNARRRRRAAA